MLKNTLNRTPNDCSGRPIPSVPLRPCTYQVASLSRKYCQTL